jgi:hypothetical protein
MPRGTNQEPIVVNSPNLTIQEIAGIMDARQFETALQVFWDYFKQFPEKIRGLKKKNFTAILTDVTIRTPDGPAEPAHRIRQ